MADHRHAHHTWTTKLGNVGRTTTNNFHLAIPPRISYQIQRRPLADSDSTASWKNDGLPRQLHQHTSSRRPNQEQQHLARSDSHMWTQHLHWTRTHYERGHQPKPIDPTLHWAIQQQRDIPNIQQVRQDIIGEIQTMTTEWNDVTQYWFTTLPAHCKLAYRQPHMITQILVLHYLLTTIHYPHADILFQELTTGFSLIGQLQPGLTLKVRTDNKYTETQSRAELYTYNRQYILKKLQQGRIDTHWKMMADEIGKGVQMGRMDGPFRAPKWWHDDQSHYNAWSDWNTKFAGPSCL